MENRFRLRRNVRSAGLLTYGTWLLVCCTSLAEGSNLDSLVARAAELRKRGDFASALTISHYIATNTATNLGWDSPETGVSLVLLATDLRAAGYAGLADSVFSVGVLVMEFSPELDSTRGALLYEWAANHLHDKRDLDAVSLLEKSLHVREQLRENRDGQVIETLNALVACYLRLGDATTAAHYQRQALELSLAVRPLGDSLSLRSVQDLCLALAMSGNCCTLDSLVHFVLGELPRNPRKEFEKNTARFMFVRAKCYASKKRDSVALPLFDTCLIAAQKGEADSKEMVRYLRNYMQTLYRLGRLSEAEDCAHKVVGIAEQSPEERPHLSQYLKEYSGILRKRGKTSEADRASHRAALLESAVR